MSMITCVTLVANTEIEPPLPAATIAAFATIFPSKEFSVDTFGRVKPVGHNVRKASGPDGTTVTFSEYARAFEGIPHGLSGSGMSRA